MTEKMLKFVDRNPEMPDKRDAGVRRGDFGEIYDEFVPDRAAVQASRCSQCGVPFCQIHCPLHNNIPDWLMLTAEGRLQEAYEMAASTNNMPEICGRICPQDRLCEGNCVIEQAGHGTVTIGSIERYITENAWKNNWIQPVKPRTERPESIGIIGAGPAGMVAAEQLRKLGYQAHVYDRYDRVGGLLVYGIPNFKLEKTVVERRAANLRDSGVQFHLNCDIGKDIHFNDLRDRHDAVLIATGVYTSRDFAVPGSGLGNIQQALDYLTASNRKGFGDDVKSFNSGELNANGKDVVVIGGGDTAMDCVRTAMRQGAKSVKCLYRRDRDNMPGSQKEVTHAEEEGVEFIWLSTPEAFLGDGVVNAVRAQRIHLGIPDATGRQQPQPIEGSSYELKADLVIKALGFDPEDLIDLFDEPELPLTNWGTIAVDWKTMTTDMDGVYAAGDIVRGASLVVWAIADARLAVKSIDADLKRQAELKLAS